MKTILPNLKPHHRNIIFLIIFFTFYQFGKAQDYQKQTPDIIPSLGYIYQWDSYLDANVIIGDDINYFIWYHGLRLGLETNLQSGADFIIAPKIGYVLSLGLLVLRLSAIDYIQGSQNEFRLLPEVGFTIVGVIDLTYGSGIQISKSEVPGISSQRFGVCINVTKLLKEVF